MSTTRSPSRAAAKGLGTGPNLARNAAGNRKQDPARNMTRIPGGTFRMGSAGFYPEERPVHRVSVDGFWIDTRPVTVEEFRRFVKATGYITAAQRPLDPAEYPDADPALLVPGSLVFHRTAGPVDLRDYRNWWAYVPGASWQHTLRGRARNCPPRRSGSTRRVAASTVRCTRGVTNSRRAAG